MSDQKRSEQGTNSSIWQPGSLGFSEPVDTKKGFYVTEATLKQEEDVLQIFIRCRDWHVLDHYVPVLKVDYDILPGHGPLPNNTIDEPPNEKGTGEPNEPGSSVSSHEEPDLHIYITLIETKAEQRTMQLSIDPPLNGHKKHKYHFPKANSAHVTVTAVSGTIHTDFNLSSTPADIVHVSSKSFDAPEGSDANVRLELTGMQGSNMYQITGTFTRVAQEAAKKADDLFEGEEDA